jgi:hypothetical protein
MGERAFVVALKNLQLEVDKLLLPEWHQKFKNIFSIKKAGCAPAYSMAKHAINLEPGTQPPFWLLYNLLANKLWYFKEYFENSVDKGWIRQSVSPAGAPILFVPKKDGGLRLCVNYRGLNAITIKNWHLLPLIGKTLDCLVGAVIYTKLDFKDAYHHI